MKMRLCLFVSLSLGWNASTYAQGDTIYLDTSTLPITYPPRSYWGRPNKGIFLSMTTAQELQANAGVGEMSYSTEIFRYTRKKWKGLHRVPHADLFFVSETELETLFNLFRRTNEAFAVSRRKGNLAAPRDVLTTGSFYVALIAEKQEYTFDLGTSRTAKAYEARLLALLAESSLDATTKEGLVALFERCFGGLTR